ncbi:hypothetical protein [Magnetospirillum molischianum]|uniref:Uncharacterized protein n=1 Tax=Magnetospirillum molischianum DSM 120 TaxID=1150626 RepID=H8FQN2_MAGML|nr:hypothetical protein [Magnetospirillum molischianum]CCG40670.1 exported hypothetical protein [Magnetospirillum molischianum DSM 120]
MGERWGGLSGFIPAAALMGFSLLWTVGLTVWPRPGEPLAVIFPLSAAGSSAFEAAVNAGAEEVLAFGGWPSVVLVRSGTPEFVDHLYGVGALLVLRAPKSTNCSN